MMKNGDFILKAEGNQPSEPVSIFCSKTGDENEIDQMADRFDFGLGYGSPCLVAGELEHIQAKGELVVSLNRDYPPFAMIIDGQLTGLDVDLENLWQNI